MKTINIKQKTPRVVKIFRKFFNKVWKFISKIAKKGYNRIMKFDLIDGQKRSESIARRVMILLLLVLSLYILLDLLVDNGVLKTNTQREQESNYTSTMNILPASPVVTQEQTEQVGVGNQTTENIPEVLEVSQTPTQDRVESYVKRYGGRFTSEYLETLRKYCDEDTLKLVVAISVAETSMGKTRMDKNTNWYGYFYGGDKRYDPDMGTMSRVICNGISKYYSDVDTNYGKAVKYTGGSDTKVWMENVSMALEEMR